jgi:hypothetical protein
VTQPEVGVRIGKDMGHMAAHWVLGWRTKRSGGMGMITQEDNRRENKLVVVAPLLVEGLVGAFWEDMPVAVLEER